MHAPGSDFIFAYLHEDWSDKVKADVGVAFQNALAMSSIIKQAVQDTSGQDVVNGLYVLNQGAMTKAMNSIPGMGLTSATQNRQTGEGTPSDINMQFFQNILAGLGGDVSPMRTYLDEKMNSVQEQAKKTSINTDFGTVIGLVSLMPVLNIPVTSFVYAYTGQETKTWFENTRCSTTKKEAYDYRYTVANYNYVKP
jgi:hypothetical protein